MLKDKLSPFVLGSINSWQGMSRIHRGINADHIIVPNNADEIDQIEHNIEDWAPTRLPSLQRASERLFMNTYNRRLDMQTAHDARIGFVLGGTALKKLAEDSMADEATCERNLVGWDVLRPGTVYDGADIEPVIFSELLGQEVAEKLGTIDAPAMRTAYGALIVLALRSRPSAELL
jgi:hypothetical protein